MKLPGILLAVLLICAFWFGGVYNGLVNKQEAVNQAWAQVAATYQRRLDLIPNLVATVKGYAQHESATLLAVTNARAAAFQATPPTAPDNASQVKQFADAQANLTSALGKLQVVVESYPNLKANENFLALQSQLEGTENRITVARERFNQAAQDYNATIRRFPGSIVAKFTGFTIKPYFSAQPGAEIAPKVSF